MGMYDNVNFEMKCQECGTILADWQTKDGRRLLDTVEIDTIDEFHTSCEKCRMWYTFNRIKARPKGKRLTDEEIAIELRKFELSKYKLPDIEKKEA